MRKYVYLRVSTRKSLHIHSRSKLKINLYLNFLSEISFNAEKCIIKQKINKYWLMFKTLRVVLSEFKFLFTGQKCAKENM